MDDHRKGVMIVVLAALLFAPDSLMLRLMAMEQWPTLFWRGLVGGGVITLALIAMRGRRYPADLAALGVPGLCFMCLFSATTFCFVFAVRETSVANTLFIVSTSPVFSALISWLFLKEPPDRRTVRTIALALCGVGLIAFGDLSADHAARPNALLGDLAALGAALTLATGWDYFRKALPFLKEVR